jgi:hypothetical protein
VIGEKRPVGRFIHIEESKIVRSINHEKFIMNIESMNEMT